ncbi:MAG TPA: LysR substrate-binding domain-containing protein [Solirubrobacteraceae bacterium]|nr:LysR substrate-binding domain-containing protein [Solirubrobacteraceae bacterium]
MELRELRYFVTLAEERHFGRAAERLYIAQSGLSKAIKRVERELGVDLFERAHRNVELTDAGVTLLTRASDVLGRFDEVFAIADAARMGLVGTLTVAVTPVARHHTAPLIMQRFEADHPDVFLVRREQLGNAMVADVASGYLDAGIAYCPEVRDDLLYEPIKDIELRVLIDSNHPLARRPAVALPELRAEHFLIPPESVSSALPARLSELCSAAGFVPHYLHEMMDYDEDLNAVRQGRGVMLSARSFLGHPPPGVSVLTVKPHVTLPLELIRRAEQPSPILARFLASMREVCAQQGWRSPVMPATHRR